MFNSSHTPTLLQKWAILPEWAIASVLGVATVLIGALLYVGLKDKAVVLMLKASRQFWSKEARR